MTILRRSKRIAQIKEEIKKNEEENDDIEINLNFPIRSKLKPLYKGKLILEKNKELEGFHIETLLINKFYDANISTNESERVKRVKKIIDKIIQNLPASGNYYVEHNKPENSIIVRRIVRRNKALVQMTNWLYSLYLEKEQGRHG